jgi:hypothetical protein
MFTKFNGEGHSEDQEGVGRIAAVITMDFRDRL